MGKQMAFMVMIQVMDVATIQGVHIIGVATIQGVYVIGVATIQGGLLPSYAFAVHSCNQ